MSKPIRYALIELTPQQVRAKLAELGHPLSEQELELAWVAASHLIGSRSGDRRGLGAIVRILGAVVTTPGPEDEGGRPLLEGLVPTRWPYPEARGREGTRAWSTGRGAVDRLGLDGVELDRLWMEAKLCSSSRPKLPLGLVLAFFPPPMLAALAAVIRLGAMPAKELLERCLLLKALGTAATGERRGEPLARESLRQYETNFRTIALILHEQLYQSFRFAGEDKNKPPTSALAGWYTMPPTIEHKLFKAPKAKTDRKAPEHLLLRRALADVRRQLLLGVRGDRGLNRLKLALALELFVELGGREAAVARICKDDLIEYYPPFGGPAVRLRPGKGYTASEVSYKPIRPELYELARRYLAWSGLEELPSRPIWIAGWGPRGVGDPLPAGTENAISQQLARAVKRAVGRPPHPVRHAVSQYAAAATRDYVDANKHSDPRLGRISEQVGARALLDQAFDKEDKLGYGDLEADREKFALIAWRGICRAVYGEEGLRRAPDWVRIEQARSELEAAERAQRAAADRLAALQQERRGLGLQEDDVEPEDEEDAAPDAEDFASSLAELVQQVRDLRREKREEKRCRRALTAVTHACDDAALLLAAADSQLRSADAELKLATETWVAVADSLDDDAFQALCANPPTWQPVESEPALPALRRSWATSKELARASGRSEPTIRNYMSGRTDCPWWNPADRERIVQGRGRQRTVAIFEIDQCRVAPIMWQRLLAICAEPPPPWYASVDPTLPVAPSDPPLPLTAGDEPPAEGGAALAA